MHSIRILTSSLKYIFYFLGHATDNDVILRLPSLLQLLHVWWRSHDLAACRRFQKPLGNFFGFMDSYSIFCHPCTGLRAAGYQNNRQQNYMQLELRTADRRVLRNIKRPWNKSKTVYDTNEKEKKIAIHKTSEQLTYWFSRRGKRSPRTRDQCGKNVQSPYWTRQKYTEHIG